MADQNDGISGTGGLGSTGGLGGTGSTGSLGSTGGLGATPRATEPAGDPANRIAGMDTIQERLREVEGRADELMDEAAERLQSAAERLEGLAERAPESGVGARAGSLAASAADTLDAVAGFLRDNDVDALNRSMGRIVGRHPLTTLAVMAGAGFIVGKALR